MQLIAFLLFLLLSLHQAAAKREDLIGKTPEDPARFLTSYVSRPDIRVPKWRIDTYKPDLMSPGYWFTAPYVMGSKLEFNSHFPYQVGPAIYDNRGELVWCGARMVQNQITFDFKPNMENGSVGMTFMMDHPNEEGPGRNHTAFFLGPDFEITRNLSLLDSYDMHEFNVLNPTTILRMDSRDRMVTIDSLGDGYRFQRHKMLDTGFKEINLTSGEANFAWMPLDHINLTEIAIQQPADIHNEKGWSWDGLHANSVDKDSDGNYLFSIRFTNTIYKISGKDGSIIWRLGGKSSDFVQNFNFSAQHHPRFLPSYRPGVQVISFLDNASEHEGKQNDTANTSAAKVVALHENENPPRAELLKEYYRPDGNLTRLRGNTHFMPNGNIIVSWSQEGYFSEHTADGTVVLEATWTTNRFDTYRAYKSEFVGRPKELPTLKTTAYGCQDTNSSNTLFHVSWNGATEVRQWVFYGSSNANQTIKRFQRLGSAARTSFETAFIHSGHWNYTFAEALDLNDTVLGRSEVTQTNFPHGDTLNSDLTGYIPPSPVLQVYVPGAVVDVHASKSVVGLVMFVLLALNLVGIATVLVFAWKQFAVVRRKIGYIPFEIVEKYADE